MQKKKTNQLVAARSRIVNESAAANAELECRMVQNGTMFLVASKNERKCFIYMLLCRFYKNKNKKPRDCFQSGAKLS